MIWLLFALLVMFNAKHFHWMVPDNMLTCPYEMDLTDDVCLGTSLMLRISFSLLIFHAFMFIVVLARNQTAAAFHDGCWATKFIMILVILIATFWIPN